MPDGSHDPVQTSNAYCSNLRHVHQANGALFNAQLDDSVHGVQMFDWAYHAVEERNVAGAQRFAAGQELRYALRFLGRLH